METTQERRRRAAAIARELCRNIGEQVGAMIEGGCFPEEWDGHEVRSLLADEFGRETSTLMQEARSKGRARWRAFVRASSEGMSRRSEFRVYLGPTVRP